MPRREKACAKEKSRFFRRRFGIKVFILLCLEYQVHTSFVKGLIFLAGEQKIISSKHYLTALGLLHLKHFNAPRTHLGQQMNVASVIEYPFELLWGFRHKLQIRPRKLINKTVYFFP